MARLNESRMVSVVGDAFGVSAAPELRSAMHAQHGAALLVGLDHDVTVIDACGARASGRVMIVPPDVPHEVYAPGPVVGMLFDAEARAHVTAYAKREPAPRAVDRQAAAHLIGLVRAHRHALEQREVLDGIAHETADFLKAESPPRTDRRVARVLDALRDPDVDRRELIEQSGISEAHLAALFVRDVGLPIRSFRLWQRLLAAVISLRELDATQAGHRALFADLAHFSRTCRRMLGHTPSAMREAFANAR
jgi:AraC-like DNA-binding protein